MPFLCFCLVSKGQDKVYLRSGEVIETNVIRFTQNALIAKGEKGEMSYDTDAIRYVLYKNGILDCVSKSRRISRQSLKLNAFTSYNLQLKALPNSVWIDSYSVFMGYEGSYLRNGFSVELIKWFKKGFGLKVPLFFGTGYLDDYDNDLRVVSSFGLSYILSTNPYRNVSFDVSGGLSILGYTETFERPSQGTIIGSRNETETQSGNSLGLNLDMMVRLKLFPALSVRTGAFLSSSAFSNSEFGAYTDGGIKIGLEYNIKQKKIGIQDL